MLFRAAVLLVAVVACLAFTGCGSKGLDGKYSGQVKIGNNTMGVGDIEFKPRGKAYMSDPLGGNHEVTYKIDGDKLTITGDGLTGNMVLTISADGSLTGGPLGSTYTKQDSAANKGDDKDVGEAKRTPTDSHTSVQAITDVGALLSEMPKADRVVADTKGSDSLETAAKQLGAFDHLQKMMRIVTDNEWGYKTTPQDAAIWASYRAAADKIETAVLGGFDDKETKQLGHSSPRAKWYDRKWFYELRNYLKTESL